MTKLIPYRQRTNDEGDLVLDFIFKATGKGFWETRMTFDPIKEAVVKCECECPSMKFGSIKAEAEGNLFFECKHIKICKKVIEKFKKVLLS